MTMKWLAAACFVVGILIRLTWHRSISLGFPVSPTMSRGVAISSILFWILMLMGICIAYAALLMRKR
jgi:hypothetical protein